MNFRIINRDQKDEDEFKDLKLLRIAVLFAERVFISNNFYIYLNYEKYMSSVMTDPEERVKFQKTYFHFSDCCAADHMFDTMLERMRVYKAAKHKSGELLLWYTKYKKMIKEMEDIGTTYNRSTIKCTFLEALIELNREEPGTVEFSTTVVFPKLSPARKNIEEFEEYKFLSGIVKAGDASVIMDTSVRSTSLFSEGFDPGSYNGRLIVSPDPLFSVPEPQTLTKDQLKYVRGEFLSSFACLSDFFKNFTLNENRDEPGILSSTQAEMIKSLFADSCNMQQIIDENLYMIHLRNSLSFPREYKVYLGLCSKDNLLRIYRELKILDESIELSLRETLFKDTNLNHPIPMLVVDYDPEWLNNRPRDVQKQASSNCL